jgi:hypothetical protein
VGGDLGRCGLIGFGCAGVTEPFVLLSCLDVCNAQGSSTSGQIGPNTRFSVNTRTPPTMTVDSGEEFTVEVRDAFDDVEDINAIPTSFAPACHGHPLAPIAGPIVVRRAWRCRRERPH